MCAELWAPWKQRGHHPSGTSASWCGVHLQPDRVESRPEGGGYQPDGGCHQALALPQQGGAKGQRWAGRCQEGLSVQGCLLQVSPNTLFKVFLQASPGWPAREVWPARRECLVRWELRAGSSPAQLSEVGPTLLALCSRNLRRAVGSTAVLIHALIHEHILSASCVRPKMGPGCCRK